MGFKILMPVDGTAVSLEQARFVIQLRLAGLQASVLVTNIQEPASFYEILRVHDASALQELATTTGQALMAPAVELLAAADVPHETMLVQDSDTVQGLLERIALQDCRMVVIGLHDQSLLRRGGLYATSERLARVSPVPVLSVRAPAAEGAHEHAD